MRKIQGTSGRVGGTTVVLAGALALAGCGSDDGGSASPSTTTPSGTTSRSSSATESSPATSTQSQGNGQTVLQAGKTGLAKVGSGKIVSVEKENSGDVWEVEVFTTDGIKHEVDISGDGATVVRGPTAERLSSKDAKKYQSRLAEVKFDFEQAVGKIADTVAGQITEVDLDDKAGKTVWEADVIDTSGVKHAVAIDVSTGEVVRNQRAS